MAPITVPGVVLSQPASSTTPSTGSERSSSSTSMARKLRYSMVVGLTITSPRLMAGSSKGMPPASSTPRLMASARSRRCAWQGDRSLQVLMMATIGRSSTSSRRSPICWMRWRCAKPRMSPAANQRRLLKSARDRAMMRRRAVRVVTGNSVDGTPHNRHPDKPPNAGKPRNACDQKATPRPWPADPAACRRRRCRDAHHRLALPAHPRAARRGHPRARA
jgi:hypothetical protein